MIRLLSLSRVVPLSLAGPTNASTGILERPILDRLLHHAEIIPINGRS
jgi:hypothetical protein